MLGRFIFAACCSSLNESPSEKEGKSGSTLRATDEHGRLNESPSEKEGKSQEPAEPGPRHRHPQ